MREVLKFEYDAGAEAALVTVTHTLPTEHKDPNTGELVRDQTGKVARVRQDGRPDFVQWVQVDHLPEPHRSNFRAMLEALPDIIEAAVNAPPPPAKELPPEVKQAVEEARDAAIAKAAELAAKERRIAEEQAKATDELVRRVAAAEEKAARAAVLHDVLEAELEEKRAEAAALDAEIAAKRAAVEAPRT